MKQARGTDLDCLCLYSPPTQTEVAAAADEVLSGLGFGRLNSIDELLLDSLLEWHLPGERCAAFSEPNGQWQLLYDTYFNQGVFAERLSAELKDTRIVQFNLQEQTDFTLRVLQGGSARFEFSTGPSFFNWGRCLGKTEAVQLARADTGAFIGALGIEAQPAELSQAFEIIAARKTGDSVRSRPVYDAIQALASQLGMPRLYRFFEGWMRSDLDWDEDGVLEVRAYRQR